MRMGRVTRTLLRMFMAWDRSARVGFGVGLALLAVALWALIAGPPELRQSALIGFGGLVIALQVIVMWANRGMVTTYTRAQRHYLAGEFDAACDLLEAERAADRADYRALTLLGNAYRQVGRLDASAEVLRAALEARPNHHFPLYGFGRTLLVQGQYDEALRTLHAARDAGAPPIVNLDIGEALYRLGARADEILPFLAEDTTADEPYRGLLAAHLRHRLGVGPAPDPALIVDGLPYWQAAVERFAGTPYGAALAADVNQLRAMKEER